MNRDFLFALIVALAAVSIIGVIGLEIVEAEKEASSIHFIVGPAHE